METNTHYPSDSSQMYDGMRCILRTGSRICEIIGDTLFRKHEHQRTRAKTEWILIQKASKQRGEIRERQLRKRYANYIQRAMHICDMGLELYDRVDAALKEGNGYTVDDQLALDAHLSTLFYFMTGTAHVARLAEMRIIEGLPVPHEDKLFSLFEPHAELINRGKSPFPYQVGHRCYVAEDGAGFIVDYGVMRNGDQDSDVFGQIVENLLDPDGKGPAIMSTDRGYHSVGNQTIAAKACAHPCVPAKGSKKEAAQWNEADDIFKKARSRHAGIEACIGTLQSANGLKRCRDRGRDGYERYFGLGILGRNVTTLGKHLLRAVAPEAPASETRRKPPLLAA
jgi:hypothetical protein